MAVQFVTSAYHKTAGPKILADENWKNFKYIYYMVYIYVYVFVWLIYFCLILQIIYFYCYVHTFLLLCLCILMLCVFSSVNSASFVVLCMVFV